MLVDEGSFQLKLYLYYKKTICLIPFCGWTRLHAWQWRCHRVAVVPWYIKVDRGFSGLEGLPAVTWWRLRSGGQLAGWRHIISKVYPFVFFLLHKSCTVLAMWTALIHTNWTTDRFVLTRCYSGKKRNISELALSPVSLVFMNNMKCFLVRQFLTIRWASLTRIPKGLPEVPNFANFHTMEESLKAKS